MMTMNYDSHAALAIEDALSPNDLVMLRSGGQAVPASWHHSIPPSAPRQYNLPHDESEKLNYMAQSLLHSPSR
jgi:hypothetical protein